MDSFFLIENESEAIRLIESGVDANSTDADERNPMHFASEYGNVCPK